MTEFLPYRNSSFSCAGNLVVHDREESAKGLGVVLVTVGILDFGEEPGGNSVSVSYPKAAGGSHGYSASPGSLLLTTGYDGFSHVSGSETFDVAASLWLAVWETIAVGSYHAPVLACASGDAQSLMIGLKPDFCSTFPGAASVNPVGLGVILLGAIELGSAAGA